jgi:ubiquitin-conjugating enzyme E2 R
MSGAAVKLLQNQLKKLLQEPVEGFTAELIDDNNMFEWRLYLEGPKDTAYAGGVFQLHMTFPPEYPMAPPALRFTSDFWHPNVYPDGRVCISILHPPVADEMSGELPEERWLPTQTVSTVMLSVMSMLSDPNISSPANVDASVEWRNNRDAYTKRVRRLVEKANREVPSRIKIPHPDTDPEERKKALDRMRMVQSADMPFDLDEPNYDDLNDFDDELDQDMSDEDMEGDDEDEDEEEEEEDEEEEPPKKSKAAEAKKVEEKKAAVAPVDKAKVDEKKPKASQ